MKPLFLSFFCALTAFLASGILIVVLRKFSLNRRLLLYRGIPLVGGIAMGLSFVLAASVWMSLQHQFSPESLAIIIAALVMLGFGVADDILELSVIAKFVVQFISVAFLISLGVKTDVAYIGPVPNILITLFWVIAITNAVNHLDIMDGLAGSITLIVGLGFLAAALLQNDGAAAVLIASLIGAAAGFVLHNLPPARVYMGNSGSHFLGFALACFALTISFAPQGKTIALLAPLLIAGMPIFDTAFLIFMRLKKSKSAFRKSNDHLALRFLKNGYSKNTTLFLMAAFSALCSVSGIMVMQLPAVWGATVVSLVVVASLVIVVNMSKVVIDG